MGKIIFIIGGIRSGKTKFAIELAKKCSGNRSVTYIATGLAIDKDMKKRIIEHRKFRPKNWQIIEEPIALDKIVHKLKNCVVVIDCINFWVRNLLEKKYTTLRIISLIETCLKLMKKIIASRF